MNISFVHSIDSMRKFPAWGQARTVIEEIDDAGKMEDFDAYMSNLISEYEEGLTTGWINDYLSYEWPEVYEALGIPVE